MNKMAIKHIDVFLNRIPPSPPHTPSTCLWLQGTLAGPRKALSKQPPTALNCQVGGEGQAGGMPRSRKPDSLFRSFNSSPEVTRLVALMYDRFPLSLRNVEDLLFRHLPRDGAVVVKPVLPDLRNRQRVSRIRAFAIDAGTLMRRPY